MYLDYLISLIKHKWYVFMAGLKTGVPLRRLIIHDWQKFMPIEFLAYSRYFHGIYLVDKPQAVKDAFDMAWLHHQKYGPHHWQYWVLIQDSDQPKALPMPETYVREMVADWMGASMAYTGSWDMRSWLIKHIPRICLWMDAVSLDRLGAVLGEQGYEDLWTELSYENVILQFNPSSPGR